MNRKLFVGSSVTALAGVALFGAACVSPVGDAPDDDAPPIDTDRVEGSQLVTSVNADGTWTADAQWPGGVYGVTASAVFTGPAGKTRRMGVCLLRGHLTSNAYVPCNSVADCSGAPASLPAGGFRYCTAPGGAGQKYCFYRPGSALAWCDGTPANGGIPVPPGVYSKGHQAPAASPYISYACFEGCTATDPSSSSVGFAYQPGGPRQ
jgi:hypothetical protein